MGKLLLPSDLGGWGLFFLILHLTVHVNFFDTLILFKLSEGIYDTSMKLFEFMSAIFLKLFSFLLKYFFKKDFLLKN